ncbi:NADH dehydrogenase [ubiquinone] 1 subunit C2 [Gadus macrocephalus]|uniref:NADH dehydrogenase [ubiquinone] 1 subunit C2 n=1 Tax=Gadus macrocephalus TaxID=80720 RepID=UPI0028CBAF91|nr:NADH dehydrogenase [ubiquinone] 1 subunit C2 [Gadus macrocephalus]
MGLVPDEAKALPPPAIVNRNSVWLGFVGWSTAMLHNAFCHRPPLKSGVHRQVLFSTIGWFLGYHISKYENYIYSKLDRDMYQYISLHPDAFPRSEKKTLAEVMEPFHPVR